MTGLIKTYLAQKQYGFIKGDDGLDYFFHHKEFNNKEDIAFLCEGTYLKFEQKATPKGYCAAKIEILKELPYETPSDVLISKTDSIKGWKIVELSNWNIYSKTSSSGEPYQLAKDNIIKQAKAAGANALINFEYFTTEGSIGNYRYTIHNYKARLANVARQSPKGEYELSDFFNLNTKAAEKSDELKSKRNLILAFYNVAFASIAIFAYSKFYLLAFAVVPFYFRFFPKQKISLEPIKF